MIEKAKIMSLVDSMGQIDQVGEIHFKQCNTVVKYDFWIDDDVEYLTLQVSYDNTIRFHMFAETLDVRNSFMRYARLEV